MKFGAEPKKLAALGVLGVLLVWALWPSSAPDSPDKSPTRRATVSAPPPSPSAPVPARNRRPGGNRQNVPDARPSMMRRAGPDQRNLQEIDPTLRTDLLAKVQAVEPIKGERNVFAFGAAPPPPAPTVVKPRPTVPPIIPGLRPPGTNTQVSSNQPPPTPVVPPIPLKFYGFTARQGAKRAFFLDGEDILVGNEGDVLKTRYKIVRIGINSVVMEDQQFHQQQTLPLIEDAQS